MTIPKHGTIQYHPSLLPKYRGPSSINWPIIKGDTETGLTIFRPSRRTGRRRRDLAEEDADRPRRHAGQRLFRSPVPDGRRRRCWRPRTWYWPASTPRRCRMSRRRVTKAGAAPAEAKIDWAKPIDQVYNLIRGCNPAPGAWTTLERQKTTDLRCPQRLFSAVLRTCLARSARSPTSRLRASRSPPKAA